jgi:hypothetical protein
MNTKPRIYTMSFASVYVLYIAKAEKKGRTKNEVDEIILWLTGYSESELQNQVSKKVNFEEFFDQAPSLNPNRLLITGSICGYKIQEMPNDLMKEIRYMDKLIDELAKGKKMQKILRGSSL